MALRSVIAGSLLVLALAGCKTVSANENAATQMKIVEQAEARINTAFDAAGATWQARFDALHGAVGREKAALVGVSNSCTQPGDNVVLNRGCAAAKAKALQLLTYLPIAEMGSDAPDGKIDAIANGASGYCGSLAGNLDCETITLARYTARSGRASTELMAMAFGPPGAKDASSVRNMISNFEQSVSGDWPALVNIPATDSTAQEALASRKQMLVQQACNVQRSTDWMLTPSSNRIPNDQDAAALMTARDQAIRAAVSTIKPGNCTGASCTVSDWLSAFLHPNSCAPL